MSGAAISRSGAPSTHPQSVLSLAPAAAFADVVLRSGISHLSNNFSPYTLNPLNINPLKKLLNERIRFEEIRERAPLKLFVAATEVASGNSRIFENSEISLDAVLASACLPTVFPAIRIGEHYYWDGAFAANPDLLTLIARTRVDDTLLVQLSPDCDPALPVSTETISGTVNRLTFNRPLRTQIAKIDLCRRIPRLPGLVRPAIRRFARHRFHLIGRQCLHAGAEKFHQTPARLVDDPRSARKRPRHGGGLDRRAGHACRQAGNGGSCRKIPGPAVGVRLNSETVGQVLGAQTVSAGPWRIECHKYFHYS